MKTSLFTNTLKPAVLALVIFVIGLLSAGNANAACKAAFRDSVVGTTVYFTSTSFTASTAHVSLNWTFGDKTTGTGGKPYHTYSGYSTSYTVCLVVIDSVNKCIDTTCATITTGACKASAYFGATNGSGGSVSFTNYSTTTSGHYSSSWDFNDGKTGSTSKSPTHTYAANGVYHVCLYVVDSLNTSCNSSFCRYDTVKNATSCYAYFAKSLTGAHVYTSNGSTTKYGYTSTWIWGDGSANSTSKSPDHTYTKNGTYHICLTVYDSLANCKATYCDSVIITSACSAHFVYALTTGMTVVFADSGSTAFTNGDKHSVSWNYGDGIGGSGDYTYHAYSKNATYTVTVTVYDSVTKCSSTYYTSVKVGNCSLASSFKYSRTANKFTFTSTSTSASKHSSYKWSYGDGSAVDSTSGTTATHTYTASAATEIVYLVIYDSTTGCVAYSSQTVTLCATKSDFTDKITGLSVAFAGDSTNSTTVNYSWNFGDKSTAGTGLRPSHTYSNNGTYSVCLTATDNATGCSSTTCSTINLCSLTASFTDSVSGRTVYFKGTTNLTSKHSTIKWYYSDGSPMDSTSGLNSHHTYASSYSSVKVYLIVYDSTTKCQFYATAIVTLCDAKSDFSYSLSGATVTLVVDTTNKSTVRFSWDFGDKTATSDSKKVTHTYTVSGPFSICLTATDTVTGCATTNCVSVSPPTCTLTASYTDSVKGSTVKFYGKSSASSHVKIIWIFGDGTTDSTSNSYDVSHTYGSSVSTESVYMRVYDSTTKCYTYGTGTVTICDAQSNFSEKISGLSASFAPNTSNKSTIKYSWNFGDKSDSRLINPSHTYASYGTYNVCLTATDSVTGCSTQTCNNITLTCSLSVAFTDSISGSTVKFYGTTGQISAHTSIKWYFGDGDSSTTGNLTVSHTYASGTGSVSVYLRVYDSTTKCLAYYPKTIILCDANSSFSDKISGLTVAFGASTANSTRIKYSWNFGDKSDSRLAAPTHTYSTGGTYQVCLTATDSVTGCSTQTCESITVSSCSLSVKFTDSIAGHTVIFSATTNASSHSSYKWIFGDGVIDSTSGLDVRHNYGSTVTTENVYLRVYDSTTKCIGYGTGTITLCTALSDYTYSVSGLTVKFSGDPNTNSSVKYSWNFGDSSTVATTSDPTHTFAKGGTYYVCLSVINGNTCSSSTCKDITVSGCTLTASITDSVSGHTVKFYGKSNLTSKHSSIKWYFGDNGADSTTGFSATHTYASSVKSANVTLRVYDSTSKCLTYATTTITFCSVSASWTYASSNLTVKFLADSASPSNTLYTWYFGDGSNDATTKDPTHTFSKPGKYRVCLYALDTPCYAEYCDSITVTAPTNATYCISGTVKTSKVAGYPAKVFLVTYNQKDSTLDSITTTQTNSKGFYEFCGLKNGTYYTKAALDTNNSYYKYFIPTYHYDATKWTGAQMITVNGASDTGENIIMKTGTNPGGAGFIGGKVSAGAGKTGDAEPNVEVVLYDSAGVNPVAYTYTNSSGYYSFSGIAFGTYTVYGEVVGKVCYPALVTITDTSSTNNTVDLLVKLTTITAAIKPAGAWTIEKADVYPNPVTNKLTLSMSIRNASPVTLKIYDITGKVVSQMNTTLDGGAQKMEVDASSLPAGLYFLRMEMTKDNTLMEAQFVKVH